MLWPGDEGRFRMYLRLHSLPLAVVSSSSCLIVLGWEGVVGLEEGEALEGIVLLSSSGEETEGDSRSSDSGDKTGVWSPNNMINKYPIGEGR